MKTLIVVLVVAAVVVCLVWSRGGVEGMRVSADPTDLNYNPSMFWATPYHTLGREPRPGSWPPGMYTRFGELPGFNTTGLSYATRPGTGVTDWQNQWVRNNTQHYFINDGKSRRYDYT